MSLYSWFTRNNLNNMDNLAKYWNPIGLSGIKINSKEEIEEKSIEPIVDDYSDDYGDKFLNKIGEKYE